MLENASKLARMVKRGGVRGVIRNVPVWCRLAYDRHHERRLGIRTEGIISVDELARTDGGQEHEAHAVFYQPWPYAKFKRMMRALPDVDPARSTFIDFGSGKGRALVLAADHGFARVVGVEMFASLCDEARDNIESYRSKRGDNRSRIEVVCTDATRYALPDGDLFCYFYNPFDEVAAAPRSHPCFALTNAAKAVVSAGDWQVMRQVLAGILTAVAGQSRRLVIGYANPVCHAVFDSAPALRLVTANDSFRVYDNRP